MFVAPMTEEWLWVYGPLAIVLLLAVGIELRSGRIPMPLAAAALAYFLASRMAIGPEARWQYPASVGIAGVVAIGIGWSRGYVGGGAAKLAVAVAAALVPWMALVVCGVPVLVAMVLTAREKSSGLQTLPGSVVFAVLTAGVVAVTALAGS